MLKTSPRSREWMVFAGLPGRNLVHGLATLPATFLAAMLVVLGMAGGVAADERAASDWSQAQNASLRLIAGGIAPDGNLTAGIEIRLAPDYKTYWRTPGESGVPPMIDFTGSVNLAVADVDFPMPHIYDEPGGRALGYKEQVVLPVRVRALDPAKPVTLSVKVDYGVCAKVCIPAEGTARLTLPVKGSSESEGLVRQSEALVPAKAVLGTPGELSVTGIGQPRTIDGRPAFEVVAEAGKPIALLAEATPADWYLEVSPAGTQGRVQRFSVSVYDPETGKSRIPCSIRLTAESGEKAIEVPVRPEGCVALP